MFHEADTSSLEVRIVDHSLPVERRVHLDLFLFLLGSPFGVIVIDTVGGGRRGSDGAVLINGRRAPGRASVNVFSVTGQQCGVGAAGALLRPRITTLLSHRFRALETAIIFLSHLEGSLDSEASAVVALDTVVLQYGRLR